MNEGIISRIIDEIGEARAEARAEDYAMVNVRPGEKVGAMLELLSELSRKSPSALVTEELSRRLAEYAASNCENSEAILDAAQEVLKANRDNRFQPGSALAILEKNGLVEVDNPFVRAVREHRFNLGTRRTSAED